MEHADFLDAMVETTFAPAEWETSRVVVKSHLNACLRELDRLGLWIAGAHLASAIDAIDHATISRPAHEVRTRKRGPTYPPAH
jgi:hypothetical protein